MSNTSYSNKKQTDSKDTFDTDENITINLPNHTNSKTSLSGQKQDTSFSGFDFSPVNNKDLESPDFYRSFPISFKNQSYRDLNTTILSNEQEYSRMDASLKKIQQQTANIKITKRPVFNRISKLHLTEVKQRHNPNHKHTNDTSIGVCSIEKKAQVKFFDNGLTDDIDENVSVNRSCCDIKISSIKDLSMSMPVYKATCKKYKIWDNEDFINSDLEKIEEADNETPSRSNTQTLIDNIDSYRCPNYESYIQTLLNDNI